MASSDVTAWQVVAQRRIAPEAISSEQQQSAVPPLPTASAKARQPLLPSRPPKGPNSMPNGSAPAPTSAGAKRKAAHQPGPAAARRRVSPDPIASDPAQLRASDGPETSGQAVTGPAQAAISFQQGPQLHVELGREAMPLGDQPEPGTRVLEAVLRDGRWELMCFSSGVQQWTDLLPSKIVAVGGSMNFAAAALDTAVLQVSGSLHIASLRPASAPMYARLQFAVFCWQFG